MLLCTRLGAADDAPVALNEDVHVVFLTDCTSYSDWQTLGVLFSWKESGQVGKSRRRERERGDSCINTGALSQLVSALKQQ